MKFLILLAVVLPFCMSIEVKIVNRYGTAIKKVEIPSCKVEPCQLVKGTPLNITLTVESRYPSGVEFPTVSDIESNVNINGYRNRFVYYLAQETRFCKQEPNECPLYFNKVYNIDRQLFLSKDTEEDRHSAEGSRNGLINIDVHVTMLAYDDIGTVIGDTIFQLDVKGDE